MGGGYSVPNGKAEDIVEAHRGYDLYPCFFMCDNDNGETDGKCIHRIGSLSDFQNLIEREPVLRNKHFTVICLGDNDCPPCDAAKEWLRENPQIKFDILQRRGSEFYWRDLDNDPLVKKLQGVRAWVSI